jgi:hypothetical protein
MIMVSKRDASYRRQTDYSITKRNASLPVTSVMSQRTFLDSEPINSFIHHKGT